MSGRSAGGKERVLSAVLFSDICGYSRQMDADEAGMLERLARHDELFRRRASEHAGRVVKTVGDSFMIAFESAVQAVRCALEVQRDLAKLNADLPREQRIEVRIGIHLGDVVPRSGDLYGETVNIASRIEGAAPVGSVTVSQAVFEQVRHKVHARADDLGLVSLKHISAPVCLHALRPADELLGGGDGSGSVGGQQSRAARLGGSGRLRRMALSLVLLLVAALLVWRTAAWWRHARRESAGQSSRAPGALGAPASTPASRAPVRGGTLRVALPHGPGRLALYGPVDTLQGDVLKLVLDPLVNADDRGRPIPGVVRRWTRSSDGTSLRLQLRPDVWFHPHPCLPSGRGRLATAADLAYSLRLAWQRHALLLPLDTAAAPAAGSADARGAVRALPAGQVALRFGRPVGAPARALRDVALVPRELAGCEKVDDMRQPVGTGPFRFAEPADAQRIHLLRADHYWERAADGSRLPHLDGIEAEWRPDVIDAVGKIARGDLDVLVASPARVHDLLGADQSSPPRLRSALRGPRLAVGLDVAADRSYLAVLVPLVRSGGALADPRLRLSLALSLDRAALVERYAVRLVPSGRFLEPRLLGHDPALESLAEDLPRARELLAEAGHPSGRGLPPLRVSFDRPAVQPVAREVARQLSRIGLHVEVVALSPDEFAHVFERRPVDLLVGMFSSDTVGDEPDPFLANLVRFGRDFAVPGSQDGAEAELERLTSAGNRSARRRAYQRAERWLLERLAVIPVGRMPEGSPSAVVVLHQRVAGLIDRLTGRLLPGHLRRLRFVSLQAPEPNH